MDPDSAVAADGQEQLPEHATVAVAIAPPPYRPAMQAACASAGHEAMATKTVSQAAIVRRRHANLLPPAHVTQGELMPPPATTPAADMPALLRTQDEAGLPNPASTLPVRCVNSGVSKVFPGKRAVSARLPGR